MTARPQDVALLPLPAVLWQWLSRHASEQDANDVAEAVRHYARANLAAALASAQAREEELRADVENLEASVRSANEAFVVEGEARADAEWKVVQLADEVLKSRHRAERLAEALREIADYSPTQIDLTDAQRAEMSACPECAECRRRKWPPSQLCGTHYTVVSRLSSKNEAIDHTQYIDMKNIARAALSTNAAQPGETT